ncbi:hypothetical protein [Quatrionicoccus australiensis]|uniref:hypothetical protein n=1 Tax=Quatrionicoccus australiensis TaxID=138118 RepID=UPI001CF89AE5|nr:hypothetical protein [Quatrionicoccus australiensis]UCV14483.1 hypothetical protein KI612_16295 [Quatrionicoccus australiensis]
MKRTSLITVFLLFLAGCDQVNQKLGLEDPAKKEATQQAEGKAVGSACRQSGRAIEDCYSIYSWLPKASIYEGWKEMDAYMRENQLETVAPQLPPPESPSAAKKRKKAEAAAAATEPESEKGSSKEEAKSAAPAEEKPAEKH